MLTDWMTSRDVWSDIDAWMRQMDHDATRSRGLHGHHGLRQLSQRFVPEFRVTEDDEAVTLKADVPGLTPEGLEVRFEAGTLSLQGEATSIDADGWTSTRRERSALRFARSFRFRDPVDADAIRAQLRDGVLTVTVPKTIPETVHVPVHTA